MPDGLFTQDAPSGLEVVLARAEHRPASADLRRAWSKRRGDRASPVLLIVAYPAADGVRVSLCGPAGDQPTVQHDVEVSQAERLGERVYYETVPALASAVAFRMGREPTGDDLEDAYEQVMLILFRLLFVAYAEDQDLLPYRTNGHYQDHSLQRRALRLTEDRRAGRETYDRAATSMWDDVRQLWHAVDGGNKGWGVPPYNGGLFSTDPAVSRAGAALEGLGLTDQEFAPALAAGSVYLHNRSGVRMATGSYFTKPFAVEHLLDHALEPALDDHIARLEALLAADSGNPISGRAPQPRRVHGPGEAEARTPVGEARS